MEFYLTITRLLDNYPSWPLAAGHRCILTFLIVKYFLKVLHKITLKVPLKNLIDFYINSKIKKISCDDLK